jgi:hypothetical protein
MVRQMGRWMMVGTITLAAIPSVSAQQVIPAGLAPVAAYTGLLTWSRDWPAQVPSDWSLPRVSFNYEMPQVLYVPVAVRPPLPAVEPVQVTVVTVRSDAPLDAVRVKQGAVVTWSNPDVTARSMVIDLQGLNGMSAEASRQTVSIPPHGDYSLAFHQPGTYRYYLQDRPDQPAGLTVEE